MGFNLSEIVTEDGLTVEIKERSSLGRLVIHNRALLFRHDGAPVRDTVRATLKELSGMTPEAATARWRALSAAYRVEIDRAALLLFRRQHGPGVIYVKGVDYHKRGPADLPAMATLALETMPKGKSGAPQITQWAVEFASALAAHWYQEKKTRPTISGDGDPITEFHRWAESLFQKVGFPVSDLHKHLKRGRKAAEQAGKVPKR
jgi:hypothetical protein